MKKKEPFVPVERRETIRQEIMKVLRGQVLSAREVSVATHIPEKEVYDHLEHIQRSLRRGYHLNVTPAECKKCGFIFKKRARLKKPGRCPVCRGESVDEPLFSLLGEGSDE